jgi:hypothetical protein
MSSTKGVLLTRPFPAALSHGHGDLLPKVLGREFGPRIPTSAEIRNSLNYASSHRMSSCCGAGLIKRRQEFSFLICHRVAMGRT